MTETGFPCVAKPDARVLILGSMPGRKSLDQQQYYAHPQNSFWPIMAALFGFSVELDYDSRLASLLEHKIALWDVAHQCVRPGSLDQAIEMDTVVANDFATFFADHPAVKTIFFNGRKAEQLYKKIVLGSKQQGLQSLVICMLPSTSPAHASMRRPQKLEQWTIIKETLESD